MEKFTFVSFGLLIIYKYGLFYIFYNYFLIVNINSP